MRGKLFCSLILLLACGAGRAQYIEFIENKGQWEEALKFKGEISNGAFALTRNGYRVVRHHASEFNQLRESRHNHKTKLPDGFHMRSHAWFVNFENASEQVTVVPEKQQPGLTNYFLGNDQSKWASDCRTFTSITYKNMYPGVDVRYYTNNGVLKYDMVLRPGANPDQVRLKYEGADALSVNKKGQLVIKTSIGEFTELEPYTYQNTATSKITVPCRYKVSGNTVSFKLGDYDRSLPLVIDPTLIFSSYSGSTADNWGFTATPGPDGSFFGGGIAFGQGFPFSPGAYQVNYQGNPQDIVIMKLNPTGTNRVYATYLGGNATDQPHSLIADPQGNLVIAGRTNSTNYPTTATFGPLGSYDIVITKLNAAGNGLVGSIKIGGGGDDGVNVEPNRAGRSNLQYNYGDDGRSEVTLDPQGNIILASCTQSTNFFTTAGALQTTRGGPQDAVFLKCNPTLSNVIFSTYYGGSSYDAAYVVTINPSTGELYFAGGTQSPNLAGNSAGALQPSLAGDADGFLAVVASDGSAVNRLTYFGTPQHDQVYGVQFDRDTFPYVMGISLGNWPVINAAFSQAGSHQFVGKLSKDLSAWQYTTKFGSNSSLTNISPVAFLVDNCENLYVTGWGGQIQGNYTSAGSNALTLTPDAFPHVGDDNDFYYIVIEKNGASQLFGSLFGSPTVDDHVDGGTSRFDPQGVIYQAACAGCGGADDFTTTPGAWSRINPATTNGACNLGMTKIRFNYSGVDGDLQADDSSGCVPLTVNFTDAIANAVTYRFDFFDGSPNQTVIQNTPNITHTFNTPGVYRVRLIATDLNTCNRFDTSYKTIRVRNDRATINFNGIKQPPCENLTYQFNNLSVAPPGKPFSNTSFIWDFGDNSPRVTAGLASQTKTYAAPGTFTVRLVLTDTNYCNAPDSIPQIFRLSPTVDARFNVSGGCHPYNASFENTSLAGQTFTWNFGDGSPVSTDINPQHNYLLPGTYTVTLTASDPNTCNLTSTKTDTVIIHPTPVAAFSFSPQPVQENTPTQFTNLSSDADTYLWNFGDNNATSTLTNPIYQFTRTDTFSVCLTAANRFGCSDTVCNDVPALVLPLLDVANAFTPNNDGRNDRIFVRGFGIVKMMWRIYNRFGQIVYQGTDLYEGWDGRYKGKLQPMEVYAYTLEVEMNDGKRIKKQGDITLIR